MERQRYDWACFGSGFSRRQTKLAYLRLFFLSSRRKAGGLQAEQGARLHDLITIASVQGREQKVIPQRYGALKGVFPEKRFRGVSLRAH